MFDFISSDSPLLLNPRLPALLKKKNELLFEKERLRERYPGHFFLATSGSTRKKGAAFKLIALSKGALLNSAKSVNKKIEAKKKDIWLNCLPSFHVGGLSIYARAYLTSSRVVVLDKWEIGFFIEEIIFHKVTISSLVPAQVYDLVINQIKAPPSLRALFVGGGVLPREIYEAALTLGWPLLLTYGMTECSSQIATSKIGQPELNFLDHIEAKVSREGFLMIRSPALLTAQILIDEDEVEVSDPKEGNWFKCEDKVTIEGDEVLIHGRASDFIKIGGESVSFSKLEKVLESVKFKHQFEGDVALIKREDRRLGVVIELVTTTPDLGGLVQGFNELVMPFENIRRVHIVKEIPRSDLKKVKEGELMNLLIDTRF